MRLALRKGGKNFLIAYCLMAFLLNACAYTYTTRDVEKTFTVRFIKEEEAERIVPIVEIISRPTKENPFLTVQIRRRVFGRIYEADVREEVRTEVTREYNPLKSAFVLIGIASTAGLIFVDPKTTEWLIGRAQTKGMDRETFKGDPRKTAERGETEQLWSGGMAKVEIEKHLTREISADSTGKFQINMTQVIKDIDRHPPGELKIGVQAVIGGERHMETVRVDSETSNHWYLRSADFSESTPALAAYPVASFTLGDGQTTLEAGRTTSLVVEVMNRGKGETSQLKAVIESPDPLLNGRELRFGKVLPGKRRVWIEPVEVPLLAESREVPIRIVFSEGNGYVPEDIEAKLAIKARGRPQFAYSVQVMDGGSPTSVGNQDGRIQRRESVDLVVYLKNTGTEEARGIRGEIAPAPEVRPQLGGGVRLPEATRTVERLAPDEVVPVRFRVDVLRDFVGDALPLQLAFHEDQFGTRLERRLVLPIDQELQRQPIEIRRDVTVRVATVLYSGAGQDTSPLARVREGTVLLATGEYADWYRIAWGRDRLGWIAKADVTLGTPPPTPGSAPGERTGGVVEVFSNSPPTIALAAPRREQVVEAAEVLLLGTIADAKAVQAVWVAVNGQRLPEAAVTSGLRRIAPGEVELQLPVPLTPGPNTLTVGAGNLDQLQREEARRVVHIEPRGAQLEALSDVDRFILDPKLPVSVPNPRRWALIVGVEKYRRTVAADFARRDATVFREYAQKRLGVPPENIALLLDEDATKANLEVELTDRLPRRVRSGGEIIVYFAGHGLADPATRRPYLLPADGNPESLAVSGMSLEAFYGALGSLPAARVAVFLDACFSGPTGRGAEPQPLLAQARPGTLVVEDPVLAAKTLVVLAAAQGTQVSNSAPETGHGLFTYHLLKGLTGAADTDQDGRIRLGELAAYVRDTVDRDARLRYGQTRQQTPAIRPEVLDAARDLDLVGR